MRQEFVRGQQLQKMYGQGGLKLVGDKYSRYEVRFVEAFMHSFISFRHFAILQEMRGDNTNRGSVYDFHVTIFIMLSTWKTIRKCCRHTCDRAISRVARNRHSPTWQDSTKVGNSFLISYSLFSLLNHLVQF